MLAVTVALAVTELERKLNHQAFEAPAAAGVLELVMSTLQVMAVLADY